MTEAEVGIEMIVKDLGGAEDPTPGIEVRREGVITEVSHDI